MGLTATRRQFRMTEGRAVGGIAIDRTVEFAYRHDVSGRFKFGSHFRGKPLIAWMDALRLRRAVSKA